MAARLTVGSLFSGVGGLELGLERTGGFETLWQVEKDPWCRGVLARRWPSARRHDDVATFRPDQAADAVDVVCGGFPCFDISSNGNRSERKGVDGERSGLWSEFARVVRELRPRYVVVENVTALLARGMGRVLGDLAACGYDAEWDCLPASAFGAPHRRDRVFLVAYPHGGGRQGVQERDVFPQAVLAPPERHDPDGLGVAHGGPWLRPPGVRRVDAGFPDRMDRLHALGNAVVPAVAEHVGRLILAREGVAR